MVGNKKSTCLHIYNRHLSLRCNSRVLRILLNFGPDINCTDSDGATPLVNLLARPLFHSICILPFLQTVELYIYENPDPEKHEPAVSMGIKVNKIIFSRIRIHSIIGDFSRNELQVEMGGQ